MATPTNPTPKTVADRALERTRARGEIRKMLTETGAASQVKISRERGKQRRSVEKTKTQQRVIERQQSEAARVSAYQKRSAIAMQQREHARVQRVQTQQDLLDLKDERRAADQPNLVERAGSSIGGTVSNSSLWSTLIMITTLFFIMIVAYVIVTNGQAFGNFTGGIGSFIHGISSNKPLFVQNNPAATSTGAPATNKGTASSPGTSNHEQTS